MTDTIPQPVELRQPGEPAGVSAPGDGAPLPLARLSAAVAALAEARTLDDVLRIADIAAAAATYARAAKLGLEAQNHAAEVKLRAERKAGALLAQLERGAGPGRGNTAENMSSVGHVSSPYAATLAEVNATRQDANRWQDVAELPDDAFEGYIAETREARQEITTTGALRVGRVMDLERRKADILEREALSLADTPAAVRECDALAFLGDIAPASADLLLTDPPYMTDVPDVAAFAAEWVPLALSRIAPHGRAYIFTGAYPVEMLAYLNVLTRAEGWALDNVLVWTYRNTLGPSPKMGYKLNWQACFHLYGPDAAPLDCPVMVEQFTVQDIAAPDGRHGNRYHTWQKPNELAERIIRHSTLPGAMVIDPFAGTGTFVSAAGRLGRVGMGADTSSEMLALCEARGLAVIYAG